MIAKKGITYEEVRSLFEAYADRENSLYDFVTRWIERQPPLQKRELKCDFAEAFGNILSIKSSQLISRTIKVIESMDSSLAEEEIINHATESILAFMGVEMTDARAKIYAAIALYMVIEGESV